MQDICPHLDYADIIYDKPGNKILNQNYKWYYRTDH